MAKDNRRASLLGSEHTSSSAAAASSSSADPPGDNMLRTVQDQVDGVKAVMQDNVSQMLSNMDKSQALEGASAALADSASTFHQTARKARRHFYWQGLKFKLAVGTALVVLLLIILAASGAFSGGGDGDDDTAAGEGGGRRRLLLGTAGGRG